jgi:hypothetical protein
MLAILLSIVAISMPLVIWAGLNLMASIAEYQENPVIEIVEEYRKKYPDTNEN